MNFSNLVPGTLVTIDTDDWRHSYLVLGRPCKTLRLTRESLVNYMCLDKNGQIRVIYFRKEDEEFMTLLPPSQEP